MGYRGKVEEQGKARLLRAENRTLKEIAEILGVSKSSVSLWVRDMDIQIRRGKPVRRGSNALQRAKQAEIEASNDLGLARLAPLAPDAFLAAGAALYAGEGAKRDGHVLFANTDAAMIRFFCTWLRRCFDIDESRLRVRVYLHQGLDLDEAERFWSSVTDIPRSQFGTPYRATADITRRRNRHEHGCAYVGYSCAKTHREIMGLIRALLASDTYSGVAQSAEQRTVNP